ncbi:MAG: exodeoxyribonuclease III [Alphaproteobacteria bacterium]
MRIATWNVNSIGARLELVLDWIHHTSPHVILFQELKCITEKFPAEIFSDLGYNLAVHGQKTYNGVAILSKSPLEDIQYGLPGFEDPAARYVEAFTNGVRVASVYVPNGQEVGSKSFAYKLDFFKHLEKHLKKLNTYKEKSVIGGDYNVAPEDADVYDAKKLKEVILTSTEERKHFEALLQTGFQDLVRQLHPIDISKNSDWYTWWDYRAGSWHKNHGMRIDHLLGSPLAQSHVKKVGVDRDWRGKTRPSDHVPLWCEL